MISLREFPQFDSDYVSSRKGCKLSQGYPRPTLPQRAGCLLPHAQCYAHYFPSFILSPALISEKNKTTCLFQTRSPSHSSFSLFLTFSLSFLLLLHSSFAFLCFVPFLAFAFVYPLQQVLWSFFSVHMLLELKVGEWRERRGGQLNPPPEGASASLLPLVHHLSLSLFLSNKQRWPQTVGCITAEQRDIKQKIRGQMTNQVRDVTEH